MTSFNGSQIVCISTKLVLANIYKEIFKEFTFELPNCDLEECSSVECKALPGTEKIIYQELKPISEPCLYKCFVVIGQEYEFDIHCLSGDKKFTKELVFSVLCTLCLPKQGPYDIQAKIKPSFCRSFIIPGTSYIHRFVGKKPGQQFGFSVGYNYDKSLLYTGSPSTSIPSKQDAGKVTAISSLTGSRIFSKFGSADEDELGFSLDISEDLNEDGWSDILVGAPSAKIGSALRAGYIRVLSGLDGSTLLEIQGAEAEAQFGWSVNWAGDLDGDGKPDILVGAPQSSPGAKTNAGSVFVYSGSSGSLLYRIDGQNPDDAFGYAIAKIGDIDGDGIPDFAVGAPFASPAGLQQAGIVYVYSGASGSLLYAIEGIEENAGLGFSLGSLRDINGDGIQEILAGAPDSSPDGRKEAGSAYIFSGLDGSQLLHFAGPISGEEVGISVSAISDIDKDGFPDLALGAPSASLSYNQFSGKVYLVSSKTGDILKIFEGQAMWAQFGWSVLGTRQLHSKLLLVGSPGNDTVYLYQINPLNINCEINAMATILITKKADILIPAF